MSESEVKWDKVLTNVKCSGLHVCKKCKGTNILVDKYLGSRTCSRAHTDSEPCKVNDKWFIDNLGSHIFTLKICNITGFVDVFHPSGRKIGTFFWRFWGKHHWIKATKEEVQDALGEDGGSDIG